MKRLGYLAAVLLSAGCSSGNPPPSAAPTVTVTTTATVTATPEPPAVPQGPLKLGAAFETPLTKITVLDYDSSVKVGDGSKIQTMLVRSCVTHLEAGKKGLGFSWGPWTLTGSDGSRYEPASDRWGHLGAVYPDDSDDLHPVGDCVKGLIQFDPTTMPATGARYRNGAGETATWKF